MKPLILLILYCMSWSFEVEASSLPSGWVEMRTPSPIILSWAKVIAGVKLEESPTVMIHKYQFTDKWKNALKDISQEVDGCRKFSAKNSSGWNQLYCEKPSGLYVFVWRGEDNETRPALESAKLWLRTNE